MKYFLIIVIVLIIGNQSSGKTFINEVVSEFSDQKKDSIVCFLNEEMPELLGGIEGVQAGLKVPDEKKGIKGKVIVIAEISDSVQLIKLKS